MKKKCGIHWIMAGAVAAILITQFSALAADKVVVIPLFSSGSGSGSGDEIPTVKSKTGRVWMDRNLGAIRVAGSKSDSLSYGWLYQWGRPADGHESRTSPTIHQKSAFDVPGHGDFITVDSASPWDWLSSPYNHLWANESSPNNPCPPGFRLPTIAEWQAETKTWSTPDAEGAFSSSLRLTMAGERYYQDGKILNEGVYGKYWAAPAGKTYANAIYMLTNMLFTEQWHLRANGLSVRCIAE